MRKVLIIEDTENNRVLLARRLKPKGFDVLMAEDGEEGLRMAREQQPDIIIVDVGLPGIDGWGVTRHLKADDATRRIPVIVLTAHAMQGDREKAIAAGSDDYETKPIDFSQLLKKMEALLSLPQSHRHE